MRVVGYGSLDGYNDAYGAVVNYVPKTQAEKIILAQLKQYSGPVQDDSDPKSKKYWGAVFSLAKGFGWKITPYAQTVLKQLGYNTSGISVSVGGTQDTTPSYRWKRLGPSKGGAVVKIKKSAEQREADFFARTGMTQAQAVRKARDKMNAASAARAGATAAGAPGGAASPTETSQMPADQAGITADMAAGVEGGVEENAFGVQQGASWVPWILGGLTVAGIVGYFVITNKEKKESKPKAQILSKV
jgi:hypothetical protein